MRVWAGVALLFWTLATDATAQSSCFVLPGASAGATESYRVASNGTVERVGTLRAGGSHVRAAFHPGGRVLYVTAVTHAARSAHFPNEPPGVRLLVHSYDPAGCTIGPRRTTLRPSAEAPNGERAYGLLVHPSGRFLYQTTASLGRIRLYDLDARGVPTFRTTFDAAAGGRYTCSQVRRLALHPARSMLYVNCNNGDAGEGTDHALQMWRIAADGTLSLLRHHTLDHMNGGVFDPVLHPSGDWLYQPVSSTDDDAPEGAGPYIRVFRVAHTGRLDWREDMRVRLPGDPEGASGARPTQAYPVTFYVGDEARTAYVALHVMIDGDAFPHGYAVFDVMHGGGGLRHRSSTALRPELKWSSHHGGALIDADGETYWLSYLTDYGRQGGGAILRYRVRPDGSLEPLPGGPVPTGVTDGRQLIPAPAAATRSSSGGRSPASRVDARAASPSAPRQRRDSHRACDDHEPPGSTDAWVGELGAGTTSCLEIDLQSGQLIRAKEMS